MITLDNLYKSYASRKALDGLSLTVAPGEVYGLIGNNGAGKTTAIRVLTCLVAADSGEATVAGSPLTRANRKLIGVAPQEISLYKHLTCRQNLRFFASLFGLSSSRGESRCDELIELFQLGPYANTVVAALSGGWQRRLNVAVSVVHQPPALVLDEPTAGLDLEARHELVELIDNLRADDVAILLTTHQLDEAERLCSRIGILKAGRLVAEGTVTELLKAIPATTLARVESDDSKAVVERAKTLGWQSRTFHGRLHLCLPRPMALGQILAALDDCTLTSLSLREVALEHAYLELTGGSCSNPA